jgi:two-component system sensor histidine kinase PilS (NtrC family)
LEKSPANTLPQTEVYNRLKWLTVFRLVVSTVLLGSVTALQVGEGSSFLAQVHLAVYGVIAGIFFLSAVYAWLLKHSELYFFQAHLQITLDTFIVSLIIFITGGFSSIFSFLYLVVVIYASVFLLRAWSFLTAILCCLQYGIIIALEYSGIIRPVLFDSVSLAANVAGFQVVYKIIMILLACLMVAFLGNLLAEQARKTRRELAALEAHVKRVDKMAAVGEMAAGLAHEIKNPLASLSGSIQLLQDDTPSDSAHGKLMRIVLRETDRLSSLLSNFLMFARPPAGEPEAIDLGKALTDTVALFEKDAKCRSTLTIRKRFENGVWIEMDPAHLRQVLWNLLANAAEAIEGTGVIDIFLDNEKRGAVRLEIRDTGCGIPKEKIKLIFDPFFTTKARGTGLGLSIVYSILESYGNRLDVESRVGEGTTFIVHFKRVDGMQ